MRPHTITQFIETHFGLVLVFASVIGIAVPGISALPDATAIFFLALLTFIACYRLRDSGFAALRWKKIAVLYALRYILLPLALWQIAEAFLPQYATGVLLLSSLPAAVSSPAFVHIYGGAVAPAFAITVLSQLASTVVIPLQFSLAGHGIGAPTHLFFTLVWCILVPVGVYWFLRGHEKIGGYVHERGKFFSILLVGLIIMLAIAKQREVILADPAAVIAPFIVASACYLIFMLFGFAVWSKHPREERITAATCSGFNNAALGVSLALMHFPPPVILFIAVSEISWALLPLVYKWLLHIHK